MEVGILDLLLRTNLIKSRSQGKRLIKETAIEYDNKIIVDWHTVVELKNNAILKKGKKRILENYRRIVL